MAVVYKMEFAGKKWRKTCCFICEKILQITIIIARIIIKLNVHLVNEWGAKGVMTGLMDEL